MRFVAVLTLPLALLVSAECRGQEATTGTTESAVTRELAQINAALREIGVTLARQAEHSRLDLLMKRTQMAAGELERSEAQLQAFENERASLEDQRSRLGEQAEAVETRMPDAPATERDAVRAEIEGEQRRIAQRLRTLEGQIAELQNRIAVRRDELRGWQAVLDRRLTEL
jgi:chromosome segregation ATPase